MLYPEPKRRKPRFQPSAVPEEPHYFDSADKLRCLQREGHTLADMARLTALTVPQVLDRLRLLSLDEGLQAYLREAGAPERIALLLLYLPDPLSRRRMAHRIVRERLCIRDAALLVRSALRYGQVMQLEPPPSPRIITAIRDVRLYRNAIRDIAEQMKTAGVRATFTERKTGSLQEMTIAYSTRRRRVERFHSM